MIPDGVEIRWDGVRGEAYRMVVLKASPRDCSVEVWIPEHAVWVFSDAYDVGQLSDVLAMALVHNAAGASTVKLGKVAL